MAAPEEYLLRFDLEKLQRQLGSSEESVTQFGGSLKELVGSTKEDLVEVRERAAAMTGSLANVTPQMERAFQAMESGLGSSASVASASVASSSQTILVLPSCP